MTGSYWSPDGMLYGLSDRDGSRCLCAAIGSVDKAPGGAGFPCTTSIMRAALSVALAFAARGTSIAKDKIVFP